MNIIGKIVAVASLAILPFSAMLWYRSYTNPYWQRFDLTLYKSVWLYLESGVCDMEVLSMPTKSSFKSEFVVPVVKGRAATTSAFRLTSSRHGDGYRTYYGHLYGFYVDVGQRIERGDLLGQLGNTGRSTGPHLHFEIRYQGIPHDPLLWLPPDK